jgi:hypothetical protein
MLLHDPKILKKSAWSNGTTIAAEEEAAPTITTNHTMDDILDISNVLSQLLSTGSTAETPSLTTIAAASALLDLPGSTTSTTQKALDKMNFECGLAGAFALDILQHLVKKEKVCENLRA